MKRTGYVPVPAVGGSSLLVIFGVLCLTVLALLSLNTALAEKRISESYAQGTREWYAADLQAQEVYARLRAGETVPGVSCTGDQYQYSLPVSRHRKLQVILRKNSGGWEVISWQTVAYPESGDSTLPVYQGGSL